MKRLSVLGFLLCSMLIGSMVHAQAPIFREYVYQAPLSAFAESAGYFDCSEDLGGVARCKEGVRFLDEEFTVALRFNNQQLQSVMLLNEFDQNLYTKMFGALNNNFTFVAMQDKSAMFDLLAMRGRVKNEQELTDRVSEFEARALNDGQLVYFFIEEPVEDLLKFSSATQAERESGKDKRSAKIIVSEDNDGAYLVTEFSLPRRDIEQMQKTMQGVKTEKF
jgi:hypothetical protein